MRTAPAWCLVLTESRLQMSELCPHAPIGREPRLQARGAPVQWRCGISRLAMGQPGKKTGHERSPRALSMIECALFRPFFRLNLSHCTSGTASYTPVLVQE
eukprot:4700958-Amphidinium_carterae.1